MKLFIIGHPESINIWRSNAERKEAALSSARSLMKSRAIDNLAMAVIAQMIIDICDGYYIYRPQEYCSDMDGIGQLVTPDFADLLKSMHRDIAHYITRA